MKKIPTLFKRDPDDMRHVLPEVTPGCEWVLDGEGVATRKYDGTCVMLDDDGNWWARREVKPGKMPPPNYRAEETDPNTGKTVGWEPSGQSSYAKFIGEALAEDTNIGREFEPGTYELCGPKVNGNPEGYERHRLVSHAAAETFGASGNPRSFEDLRKLVIALGQADGWEGIVWHHPDGRMAKLKARDFAMRGEEGEKPANWGIPELTDRECNDFMAALADTPILPPAETEENS